jgi:hypothetical protein
VQVSASFLVPYGSGFSVSFWVFSVSLWKVFGEAVFDFEAAALVKARWSEVFIPRFLPSHALLHLFASLKCEFYCFVSDQL